MYATGIDGQTLQRELGTRHSARLDAIAEAVDDTILELRASIHNLRTGMTGVEQGAAVLRLIRQAGRSLGFAPEVTVRGTLSDVPAPVLTQLLAVLGEALTNVSRHAGATRVDIAIRISTEDLSVEVADNGRGIGPVQFKGGLANLASRAAALGGTFESRTREPAGTVLLWQVPLTGSDTPTRDRT